MITTREQFQERVFDAIDEQIDPNIQQQANWGRDRPDEVLIIPGLPNPTPSQWEVGVSYMRIIWGQVKEQGIGCVVAPYEMEMDLEYGGAPIRALGIWIVQQASGIESCAELQPNQV